MFQIMNITMQNKYGITLKLNDPFSAMIGDPKFATGVGLVLYGASHEPVEAEAPPQRRRDAVSGPGFGRKMVDWVREFF